MAIDEELETWCDIADVKKLTDQVVTEATLTQAQGIIDLFSGVTFGSRNNISPRNLRHLLMATAYQAGWMPGRPDLFTHTDVDTVSQDGSSYTRGHENAELLAPFAHRALRRLTWQQKPLRVRRRYGQTDNINTPRDSAVADDNRTWRPM